MIIFVHFYFPFSVNCYIIIYIAENIVDIEILKQDKLQGLIPEYADMIECSRGINYNSILYILSSDFAIVVVTTEELSKFLLE